MASEAGRGPVPGHGQAGPVARAGGEEEGVRAARGRLHDQDRTLRVSRLQEEEEGAFQV